MYLPITVIADELGRPVAVLADEHKPAGTHGAALQAADLKSGCYFYRLNTGGAVTTGKILVVR